LDPNSLKSRCPEVIFAAKRTDKVRGRMRDLMASTITMKGIKGGGVLRGTKWLIRLLGVFDIAITIWPIHKGKAMDAVKDMWLEAVNTYGISPKILLLITLVNKAREISRNPGADSFLVIALNSDLMELITFKIKRLG